MTGPLVPAPSAAGQLRSYLELGPFPGAVPCARLHTKLVLWEWDMAALTETAELVVSELVTNALSAYSHPASTWPRRHGPGQPATGIPPIRFWLACDRQKLLIQVWDASDRLPVLHDADPGAEGGHGLLLVQALSAGWGTYLPDAFGGKVTWALVTGT